jgi:hypothetical protein
MDARSERPATGLGSPDPRRTWPKAGAEERREQGEPKRHVRLAGTLALQGRSLSRAAARPRHIRKLNVCQSSRRSHCPTVRLPTLIRAVPRMPGVKTPSGSSSVTRAS